MLVLTPAAPIPLLSPTEQQCYGAGGGLDLPARAQPCKMWQEVAQTKKSRGMVAIGSKDVKDCEGIVGEVELCRRVRAEMASECWF